MSSPQPTRQWIRQALVMLGLVIAAHVLGYMSGDWRPGGYTTIESIYVCRDDGSKLSPPVARQGSTLHLCGVILGDMNWEAGMYISHNGKVIYSTSVQLPPGAFSLAVPIDLSWQTGQYEVEFSRAQKFITKVEFDVLNLAPSSDQP